ncbi:MAG: hypothetical protein LBU26_05895 [Synergistaceae bacterium]|jgi:hypothetical protein|nr:hypothetical protein [Synergistaceae bacterium]
MKRILAAIFALSLFLVLPAPARAFENDALSISLPDNWKAVDENSGGNGQYAFGNADDTAAVIVLVSPVSGYTSKEFAEEAAAKYEGAKAIDNGDGLYRFTAMGEAHEVRTLAGVFGGQQVLVAVVGSDPDLLSVAASLVIKLKARPDVKNLF